MVSISLASIASGLLPDEKKESISWFDKLFEGGFEFPETDDYMIAFNYVDYRTSWNREDDFNS